MESLLKRSEELAMLDLEIEGFGEDAVLVHKTPALLGSVDAKALVRDLADRPIETGETFVLQERLTKYQARLPVMNRVLAPTGI